jgi:hypothetical protein
MESVLKNIESEAAKLQIQLELNEIELEKYNKEYLEELSQLMHCNMNQSCKSNRES